MNLFKQWKQLDKELKTYYLIKLFVVFGLNLVGSIFFLYPLSFGMNFFQMMFVYFSLVNIVSLITNIPSGIIADKYGAKLSMCLSFLFYVVAYIFRGTLPYLMVPLIAFVISEFFIGMGNAFWTGADEKYLYSFKKKTKDTEIFSFNYSLVFITRAISTLIGGVLVYFTSMRWTQIIGGLLILIGLILSLNFMKAPRFKKQKVSTITMYKEGFNFAKNHKKTFYLIFGVALMTLGTYSAHNVFQPLLKNLGLDPIKFAMIFGAIFTLQMIFSSAGSFFSGKVEKRIKHAKLILIAGVLASIALISMSVSTKIFLISLLIWLIAFSEGIEQTLQTVLINRFIKKEHIRATVISIQEAIVGLFIATLIPIIGKLTDLFGINVNLYISSSLILLGAITLYIPHLNESKKNKKQ